MKCPGKLRNMKKLYQEKRYLGPQSNLGPPERDKGTLITVVAKAVVISMELYGNKFIISKHLLRVLK
jgi:hypothetical protein